MLYQLGFGPPKIMATMLLPLRIHRPPKPRLTAPHIRTHHLHEDNTVSTMRSYVVSRYQTHQLGVRLWSCRVCGKRATDLYHSAISILSPLGSKSVDTIIPTCKSLQCLSESAQIAHDFGKHGMPDSDTTGCENCGNKSRVKLCGSCTFSRECDTFLSLDIIERGTDVNAL